MQAQTLNCPMCGAATETESTQCHYCGARLATVACPSCFGMIFKGTKFCPHCGARAARAEETEEKERRCPRCRTEMKLIAVGSSSLRECPQCEGLWVDVESFNNICADREQQSAVLGAASPAPSSELKTDESRVRYVPCPECGQLMNRINFARCSGVVVDVCKGHGTWFDRDELRQIVEFIRAGGLEASRARELTKIEEERRALQQEQLAASLNQNSLGSGLNAYSRAGVLHAARGLLKIL